MKRSPIGFSLLELIVTIGIITGSLFSIVGLHLASTRAAAAALVRARATLIASEGVEVIRAMRDSNWLAGCPSLDPAAAATSADWYVQTSGRCYLWNTGLAVGMDYTAIPIFDVITNRWTLDFSPVTFTPLVQNEQGLLVHGVPGQATPYARILELLPICRSPDGNEVTVSEGTACGIDAVQVGIDVRARVTSTSGPAAVLVNERLYNWR